VGHNIRFLKSDLEPFRVTFKQEVGFWQEDWEEAQRKLRERLQARGDKILDVLRKGEKLQFSDWLEYFLENYSKPPIRAEKTHEANRRAARHLSEAFGRLAVGEITADDIELSLRRRLQTRVHFRTAEGVIQKDRLKPATVHQELRVLRRILNVAIRKRLLPANPCSAVEFPVKVKGMFVRIVTWSEQLAHRVPGT
jgi:Phage integrase SAM-like domain